MKKKLKTSSKQAKEKSIMKDVYKNMFCNLMTLFCVTVSYYFKVYCEPYLPVTLTKLFVCFAIFCIVTLMVYLYNKLKNL